MKYELLRITSSTKTMRTAKSILTIDEKSTIEDYKKLLDGIVVAGGNEILVLQATGEDGLIHYINL